MKNLDYRLFYRRNLPHIQPRGATFLINFRLAGSLPEEAVEGLRIEAEQLEKKVFLIKDEKEKILFREREQHRLLLKWDDALHQNQCGPLYLRDDKIAETVANSIGYHDGEWFDVVAYCIMPNHMHLVITPREKTKTEDYGLPQIMHNIKRNSANHANKLLGRGGAFWQHESYDHFARDEAELERIIKYILFNPVKAKLVGDWKDWKWTFCKYDF